MIAHHRIGSRDGSAERERGSIIDSLRVRQECVPNFGVRSPYTKDAAGTKCSGAGKGGDVDVDIDRIREITGELGGRGRERVMHTQDLRRR